MLSGIKIIPRDQLSTDDLGEETRKSSKKEKKVRRKKKERRRKDREYSSDSQSGSSQSGGSSEEERISKKRRKGRRGKARAFEGSTSGSSDDEVDKRKGKKKSRKDLSDDDREDLNPQSKELARKEMGLEWMLRSAQILGSKSLKDDVKDEELQVEQVKKPNPRELNPYLKDNGSGYPEEESRAESGTGQLLSSSVVGDGGASWRLKALKRAKEQAVREGRKLDEVVEERWGSLGHLAASVATQRAAPSRAHLHAIKDRKKGQLDSCDSFAGVQVKEGLKDVYHAPREYLRDISSRHPEMKRPKQDSLHWKRNQKKNISSEESFLISDAISGINKFSNDGSFMEMLSGQGKKDDFCNSAQTSKDEANNQREDDIRSSTGGSLTEVSSLAQGLTANQLVAKVLQLRMKGRHEEAEQLSKEMEAMNDKPNRVDTVGRQGTDLSANRYFEKKNSSEQKKREDDGDLHLAQTIMRNKKYSIAERADDEYDYDGEAPNKKHNRKREATHQAKQSIPKRLLTQQERCQFCFENPSRPKHLVVSIGNFTYMMLPHLQPVVPGHCCILPMQHETSMRTVDKNVWEEIRNFKKCLLRMFGTEEKDVVFIETVIDLSRQRRHCLIECIPIPQAIAKQAPGYFKKAIDEAEDEWGQHEMKKVIPTSGNLKNVIPENLSYFHVEFGLDRGFVHVIDDDANFPSSFGLNVVRGMLRLPEEDMHRRRRHEPLEKQKQAVASFAKDWEPFDWTKQLD